MNDQIKRALQIRYVKLHFELLFMDDSYSLPVYKPFALRGGLGEMLMEKSCLSDRKCDSCGFKSECIMQRVFYSKFDDVPFFVTEGGSCGYVIECEDYRREISKGETLQFQIILFGKTIAYFTQIVDAYIELGKSGLGTSGTEFTINQVTNSFRETLYKDGVMYREKLKPTTLQEYVSFRMLKRIGRRAVFHTPTTFLIHKRQIMEFDSSILLRNIVRRLYMLDLFEGIDIKKINVGLDGFDNNIDVPETAGQESRYVRNRRFPSRNRKGYFLGGIRGYLDFRELNEDQYAILLAGELVHVGKHTSFGYGRYTMV